jgi:hypothetical protein
VANLTLEEGQQVQKCHGKLPDGISAVWAYNPIKRKTIGSLVTVTRQVLSIDHLIESKAAYQLGIQSFR